MELAKSPQERIIFSRILDKVNICQKYNCIEFTNFYDPYTQNVVQRFFTKKSDIYVNSWGGYEDAERKILSICAFDGKPDNHEYNIATLNVVANGFVSLNVTAKEHLTHRDYMGAVLSLGITREKIGDILINENGCYIFCCKDISEYICLNLDKVGNVKTKTTISEDDIRIPPKNYELIKGTVASMRLDSIISLAIGKSRSVSADLICGGKVNVNWEAKESVSHVVKAGDIISIRGFGRIEITEIGKITKKGRIFVNIARYV